MPKLGELNFKDPSPDAQLKKNDDDDIGVIRSTLSGIASGVLKIPEGTVATRLNRAKKKFIEMASEKHISFFE